MAIMKSVCSSMPVDTEGLVVRSSNHLYLLSLSYLFGDGGQEFARIRPPLPGSKSLRSSLKEMASWKVVVPVGSHPHRMCP